MAAYDWQHCVKCGKPKAEMTGYTLDGYTGLWCWPCNVNVTVGDNTKAREIITGK